MKILHKPRQSSKIFEANELATLRMSHKVDKFAEQQEMFMQKFSQANTLKRQESRFSEIEAIMRACHFLIIVYVFNFLFIIFIF